MLNEFERKACEEYIEEFFTEKKYGNCYKRLRKISMQIMSLLDSFTDFHDLEKCVNGICHNVSAAFDNGYSSCSAEIDEQTKLAYQSGIENGYHDGWRDGVEDAEQVLSW